MRNSAAPASTNNRALHLAYLAVLEKTYDINTLISAAQLCTGVSAFLKERWILAAGYQAHIVVPVLDDYDEIAIDVDEEAGTFSYLSPVHHTRRIVRPLSEVMLYTLNIEAWLNSLSNIFAIEPSHRARQQKLIDSYLWYLGEVRIGSSHQFAPLYIARHFSSQHDKCRQALNDPVRLSHGIIFSPCQSDNLNLCSHHQLRHLDDVLVDTPDGVECNQAVLERLLQTRAYSYTEQKAYFDDKTGQLKLPHLESPITFIGIQKKIIRVFWNARDGPPLTWAEIKLESGSAAKSIDQAFNKRDNWTEWIERAGHGKLRIRT